MTALPPKPDWIPVFWQTLRLMTSCALSYIVTGMLALPDGYWAVITSIIVTQPAFDATLQAGRNRIGGTLIGALAGFAVIVALDHGAPLDVTFWIALLPLAVLTAVWPALRLSGVTLVVMVLIPGTTSWHRPLDRVLEILIGTIASIVVSALILPRKPEAAAPPTAPLPAPAIPKTSGEHAE